MSARWTSGEYLRKAILATVDGMHEMQTIYLAHEAGDPDRCTITVETPDGFFYVSIKPAPEVGYGSA